MPLTAARCCRPRSSAPAGREPRSSRSATPGAGSPTPKGRVVVMHGAAVVVGRRVRAGGRRADRRAGRLHAAPTPTSSPARASTSSASGCSSAATRPQPGVYDDAYLESFVRTQRQLAHARGSSPLVDFHQDQLAPRLQRPRLSGLVPDRRRAAEPARSRFPQGYFANPALNRAYDHLWANAPGPGGVGLQDRFARGLGAGRGRASPTRRGLLGYDIFNEPWPGQRLRRPARARPAVRRRLRPDRADRRSRTG